MKSNVGVWRQARIWDNGRLLVGYARASTVDQPLDLHVDAFAKAGRGRVFTDDAS